ncbi:NADP-dependent oxidoreductase domain-containing protein [Dendryphion nanum]|uniref:NADP-dependent oxidoreductase domain-containing protein n=1 Tax=Dendryphion nanum TaxID=256645 RepID=A0A9P9IR55_9PLEO|nr:NADP-dependent oxidoreductase domain-containing protein [Dendryphion nanum]
MADITLKSNFPLENSQHEIPRLGFGVYLSPVTVCVKSCLEAFKSGYRHIDTAQYYENEASVGRAILESRLPRNQIFVTTKILSPGKDVESTYRSVRDSVEKLVGKEDDGYVDLFLIHSPNGGAEARKLMWQALEKAKEEKIVRDIGVSNYGIAHIEEMREYSKGNNWPPVVNQIELHPWCQQREIVEYCEKNKIVIEAYSPLVRNLKAEDKTLEQLSKKHAAYANQILIRWSLQKGFVPLPKSDTPSRIHQNAQIFNFKLDEEDMKLLDGLDQGRDGAIVQAVTNS